MMKIHCGTAHQVVRVGTRRGRVVLASDLSHFYLRMQQDRAFPELHNLGDRPVGSNIVRRLATSAQHIIAGRAPW